MRQMLLKSMYISMYRLNGKQIRGKEMKVELQDSNKRRKDTEYVFINLVKVVIIAVVRGILLGNVALKKMVIY